MERDIYAPRRIQITQENLPGVIKYLRRRANLTQETAGEKYMVSSTTVKNWEKGHCLMRTDNLFLLMSFYGYHLEAIRNE